MGDSRRLGVAGAGHAGPSGRDEPGRPSARAVLVSSLGAVAALAYCSWPLGYLTSPSLVTHGLASDLEAHGVPYFWLYIGLDCLTGVVTVLVTALAWGAATGRPRRRGQASGGLAVFGALPRPSTRSSRSTARPANSPRAAPTCRV